MRPSFMLKQVPAVGSAIFQLVTFIAKALAAWITVALSAEKSEL